MEFPRKFPILLVVIYFWAVGYSFGAEQPPLTALLPDETIAVVQVPSVPALIRAYEGSQIDNMYRDPDAGKVFKSMKRENARSKERMVARDAVSNQQLRAFARGQVILAAIPTGGGAKSIQWIVLFEHNNDPAVVKALKAGPKPSDARVETSVQQIGPFPMTRMRVVREVPAKIPGGRGKQEALRQVSDEYDEYLGPSIGIFGPAAGNSVPRILERLVRAQSGETLAEAPVISAARALKSKGHAVITLDVGRIVHQSIQNASHSKQNLLFFDPRALEIPGVRAAASIDLKPDRVGAELVVDAPPNHNGAAQLLLLASAMPQKAAELVPPDAFAYTALGYPLDDGWRKLRQVFAAASPSLSQSLDMQFQSIHQATGTNVEARLFHNLDGSLIRFVWPGNGGKTQLEMSTFIVRVKDAKAFQASLDLLLKYLSQGLGLYQIVRSEYLGQPVWGLRPGRPDVQSQVEPSLWFSLAGSYAVAGMHIEGVREAIRRIGKKPSDSLAQRSRFKAAMAALPADRQGEAYVDLGAMARVTNIPAPVKDAAKRLKVTPLMPGESGAFGKLWNEYYSPIAASRIVDGNRMRIQAVALAKKKP